MKNKITTRHKVFSLSGILTRFLILLVRITPPPTDVAVAVAFGITEMLGARRLLKILGPAIKTQLKSLGGKHVTRT